MDEIEPQGGKAFSIGDRACVTDGPHTASCGVVVGIGVTRRPYAGLRRVVYTVELDQPPPGPAGALYPHALVTLMTMNLLPDAKDPDQADIDAGAQAAYALRSRL